MGQGMTVFIQNQQCQNEYEILQQITVRVFQRLASLETSITEKLKEILNNTEHVLL